MEKSDSSKYGYPEGTVRISQWDIAKFLLLRHCKTGGLLAACVVITLLIYGIASGDIRFMILSMMLLFILIPMIYSFIFIKDMLHPDIAFNTLPHLLMIDKDKNELVVSILVKEDDFEEKEHPVEEGRHQWVEGGVRRFSISMLGIPYLGINHIIYPVEDTGWVFIPYSSIKSDPELNFHNNK